jgi:hypothetical protein
MLLKEAPTKREANHTNGQLFFKNQFEHGPDISGVFKQKFLIRPLGGIQYQKLARW